MKKIAKRLVYSAACVLVAPLWLAVFCHAAIWGRGRALSSWSQTIGLLPGQCGVYLRRAFYSGVLEKVDEDCVISFGVLFSHPKTAIGRSAYIGPYSVIGEVDIQDDVLIGSQVSIMNGSKQHGIERLDCPIREQPGTWPRVTIGTDSWLGDRAIVMADVGKHCVVGAGAVVTRPVPDYAIVVGNPARIVKYRQASRPHSLPMVAGVVE
ncbi:acyltransferase [Candidatus Laterigemmans baculatus]|uniref:acyltransferase n=1 Tax=Candidatus Laterigemmans baculatus TaxID=2770505 RepID=UPI0013D9DA78|nr:acyltransferase [Candidatus Laterigemmans baculatus]